SEYIKEIVLSNKEVVYNLYKINHVYLYGSYSKGLETKYSDIDLLIQADDLPGDTLKQILAFYNAIFEIPVDVHSIEKEEKFVGFSPELIY
ncbi:MAG: nucleotidyltransferase domain-containing protein, partial [Acholeplasmatales bacterium]|nr:nucleotidyltransferase domain-containing protein [Acholeplasmatales bacterium]